MTKDDLKQQIIQASQKVRQTIPLAPSITNGVTMNFVANAQLACGGSAAMVYLAEEGETVAEIGGAVYINMGTLLPVYEETLIRTAKKLSELKKQWVLDPVGLGIGSFRTKLLEQLKMYPPSIVRGNASEIIALAKLWNVYKSNNSDGPKGVESVDSVDNAKMAAIELAKFINGAVAVSGKEDLVTDGTTIVYSSGGSHFMEKITGAGCSLGGVCAVYACVCEPFVAALSAVQHYNLAGVRAEKNSKGPASFQVNFLDEVYIASPQEIAANPFKIEGEE